MKNQDKQQDQKVTSTEEVELTEEELDQASGGWSWGASQSFDGTKSGKGNYTDAGRVTLKK